MKLSIQQLINFRTAGPVALAQAFSEALGADRYVDPDYSMTQQDVDAVAKQLDRQYADLPLPGAPSVFGPMTDQECRDVAAAYFDACHIAREIFRVSGLYQPDSWSYAG